MSTTKNEQYHILSPEWLKKNPLPEDAEFRSKGIREANWNPSNYRRHIQSEKLIALYEYRTQRTDLPPEAYITPPQKNEHNPDDDGPEEMENIAHIDTKFVCRRITPPTDTTGSGREGETPETLAMFKRLLDFRGSDLADEFFADVAKLERQRDAALAQVEALRRDGELLDHLDSSLNQLAIFGNFVMGGEKQSARAAIRRHMEHCKRAAIDSAQRQEGSK